MKTSGSLWQAKPALLFVILTGVLENPSMLHAQSPSPGAYAVATIKPTAFVDDSKAIMSYPGGRFVAKGMTLKDLIAAAYGIRFGSENQVVGGPAWVTSMRFDIEAKPDQPTPIDAPIRYGPQLQALLADRFGLKIHHEIRQVPVFRLEVATKEPKLTRSPTAELPPAENAARPVSPLAAAQGDSSRRSVVLGPGHVIRRDTTMKTLTEILQLQPEVGGRAVIDATGLSEQYDFELQWTPEGTEPVASGVQKGNLFPSLFIALREELGLKLERATGPLDEIVIDRATQPAHY